MECPDAEGDGWGACDARGLSSTVCRAVKRDLRLFAARGEFTVGRYCARGSAFFSGSMGRKIVPFRSRRVFWGILMDP